MNKLLILAACSSGVAATGATYYYVSPASRSATDVPPVVTDLPPDAVMSELLAMTPRSFMQQVEPSKDADQIDRIVTGRMTEVAPGEAKIDLAFMHDQVITMSFKVSQAASGKTEVDIKPVWPDSRFTRSKSLHPYDLTALGSIADLWVSEYVSSVLNRQRMAGWQEMEHVTEARIGFTQDQQKAFGARIEAAARSAYASKIELLEHRRSGGFHGESSERWGRPEYYRSGNLEAGPNYYDRMSGHGDDAAEAASDAAYAARDAAESARLSAQ